MGGVEKLYRAAHHYGLKRSQVIHWLQQQPGYTLHKLARKKFPRNKVFVNGLDEQCLSQWNRGHKYILTCIDVLSKHAWAVAIKTKTGSALVAAFTEILGTFRSDYEHEFEFCAREAWVLSCRKHGRCRRQLATKCFSKLQHFACFANV